MKKFEIKIAGVQFNPTRKEVRRNREKIIFFLKALSQKKVQLAIFPECCLTGYALEKKDLEQIAETIPGPSIDIIEDFCRTYSMYTVLGLIEKDDTHFFNTVVMVGPSGVVAHYRKTHLPYQGVDRYVHPGEKLLDPIPLDIGKIGILICYDVFFPETVRALTLKGAELIVIPTNWAEGVEFYTDYIIFTRALENHINIAAINRVGREGKFKFYGKSMIVNSSGKILAQGDRGSSTITANVNVREPHNKKIIRIPGEWEVDILDDRRPELYSILQRKSL